MRQVKDLEKGVSRETLERLHGFAEFVILAGRKINLIGPLEQVRLWERHVLDSLQLLEVAPAGWKRWADLGSGAGFPGLVIGIAATGPEATEQWGPRSVILVEADRRKAAFLREAAMRFAAAVEVIEDRIEAVPPLGADVLSARALAPLPVLLQHVHRHLRSGGVALLPKGDRAGSEVEDARKDWRFDVEYLASQVGNQSVVLRVQAVEAR